MAPFRLKAPSRLGIGLVCTLAAAAVAWGATRAESARAPAKRFVATLIAKSAATVGKPPSSDCLASSAKAPVTVGAELAAIFGRYIDSDWPFEIGASCQQGESVTRQFCTLNFAHQDKENEASAGFTFLGNPADGAIDTDTLECFQTP